MKILLLSLLRLGDILLHRQAVQSLKRQHPGAEIHVLIYSQFQSVCELLPEVNHWHFLNRKEIQEILVERRQSPIQAFEKLESLIQDLNNQKFDAVYNLTHNKLSVRLMDLIQAQQKFGVALQAGRKTQDRNAWQTYLNENFSETGASRFHYLEVLQKSLEIPVAMASVAEKRNSPLILLQLLTSDVKKNWGLSRFHQLKRKLEATFPQHRVLGICSPQEKDQVAKVFDWNEFLTPSLQELNLLLKEASMLVTGDTSVQHLAAEQACPVVSLFLGSADPVKTSPWQMGAWVIQGQAPCAPCSHSQACHQATHLCADSLSVEQVHALVTGILRGESQKVAATPVYQTESRRQSHFLRQRPLNLLQVLEHQVWSHYLDGKTEVEAPQESAGLQELENIQRRHKQFQSAVRATTAGGESLSHLETQFPEWKDSLTRWKRDFRFQQEVQALSAIRDQVLNHWISNMEAEHGRRKRPASQERLAEA